MVERTAVGSSAHQSKSLPAPASRLVATRAPYVRDSLVLAALGVGGGGMASILSQPQWSIPSVTAGVVGGAATLVEGRLRQLRNTERDRLVESLAPLLSAPRALLLDRRMVHTQMWNWTSSWPGVPRRIRLRYSPGAASDDPQWISKVLATLEQRLLRNYQVVKHDRRRCRLVLALASSEPQSKTVTSAVRERVERTVAELIGPTAEVTGIGLDGEELTKITVRHQAGTRLAASGYRARIERTISTVLQGRWRASWDLEHDEVVFMTRREFPATVWLHPVEVDAQADILSTYDDVAIPHSVDEDGVEQVWRPAIDPNLLVVGAPGTGKTSLEHCILASIARYGWPIWVVDGKGIEFLGFRGWPNVQVVATRIEEQIAVLERAWEVMEYRYQLIVTGRARKSDFEPLMVFLDEFADFRSNLLDWYPTVKRDKAERGAKKDPAVPPVLAKIASIARKGRSSRVHLLFATQRPDATYFGGGNSGGGDMRDNFRCRISMGRLSIQGAMMMWQDPTVGVTIPRGKRGRATTIDENNRPVESQGYRCPDPHDDTITSEHKDLLERLRPAKAQQDRLLILLPQPVLDPETQELMEPSYRDYAAAEWVRAAEHPELDPEISTPISPEEARLLSSPMTVFGLTGAQRPVPSLLEPASDDPADDARRREQTDDDLYGPTTDVRPDLDEVQIGDLLLVDEDSDHWAVVDGEAGEDPADPTSWAIPWRDDADECGLLSVPDSEGVTIRRALEELS